MKSLFYSLWRLLDVSGELKEICIVQLNKNWQCSELWVFFSRKSIQGASQEMAIKFKFRRCRFRQIEWITSCLLRKIEVKKRRIRNMSCNDKHSLFYTANIVKGKYVCNSLKSFASGITHILQAGKSYDVKQLSCCSCCRKTLHFKF